MVVLLLAVGIVSIYFIRKKGYKKDLVGKDKLGRIGIIGIIFVVLVGTFIISLLAEIVGVVQGYNKAVIIEEKEKEKKYAQSMETTTTEKQKHYSYDYGGYSAKNYDSSSDCDGIKYKEIDKSDISAFDSECTDGGSITVSIIFYTTDTSLRSCLQKSVNLLVYKYSNYCKVIIYGFLSGMDTLGTPFVIAQHKF